jgi:hypothetical protein
MKSKRAQELITWLYKDVRLKNYKPEYLEKIVEISEIELSGDDALLEKKVDEFKCKFSLYGEAHLDVH